MNAFRSKSPWELLFFAVVFAIAALIFLTSDQPFVIVGGGRDYGKSQSIGVMGTEGARFMGGLSAFLSVGLVCLFFWVRHKLKNNR